MNEEYEPYLLQFNECKKWGTGNIRKSDMKVPLPNPPPLKVNHEILGIGDYVKTHPLGHMSHIRKGTKDHEYNFRKKDNQGRESLALLYFLDPDP